MFKICRISPNVRSFKHVLFMTVAASYLSNTSQGSKDTRSVSELKTIDEENKKEKERRKVSKPKLQNGDGYDDGDDKNNNNSNY